MISRTKLILLYNFIAVLQYYRRKLENWRIYLHLDVKIKMALAGLIFEPNPQNFENQYNFWRCLNGTKIIFWYL